MIAEKMIVETDGTGRLKSMPVLPPNKRLETIFLVIGEASGSSHIKRKPCGDLKGTINFHGDVINTVQENDWDLPK